MMQNINQPINKNVIQILPHQMKEKIITYMIEPIPCMIDKSKNNLKVLIISQNSSLFKIKPKSYQLRF